MRAKRAAMKVKMVWVATEGSDHASCALSLKVKLPSKWRVGPTSNLKSHFVDAFNDKYPNSVLDLASVQLVSPGGAVLADADVAELVLQSGDKVSVSTVAPPPKPLLPKAKPAAHKASPLMRATAERDDSTMRALAGAEGGVGVGSGAVASPLPLDKSIASSSAAAPAGHAPSRVDQAAPNPSVAAALPPRVDAQAADAMYVLRCTPPLPERRPPLAQPPPF